jgi:hypothetical protein
VITIDIEARTGAGYPVDIFCVIQRGSIYYSYDGTAWGPGLGNCYFTGPLADMSDTILNMNIPLGSYLAYLALDVNADGVLQVPSIFDYDVVDFTVIP